MPSMNINNNTAFDMPLICAHVCVCVFDGSRYCGHSMRINFIVSLRSELWILSCINDSSLSNSLASRAYIALGVCSFNT